MRGFYQRAVERLDKIDQPQLRGLFRQLASDNDLLGMVLDSMARGIVVTNTDGDILLANRAAVRLVPLRSHEYAQQRVWKAVADEEIAEFLRDTVQRRDTVRDREFTISAGATRTLSFGVLPLVHDGHVAGNLILADDVTERRATEARLRRAESLAALTTLTAGVAHEIKNPLGAIGIHLQLIERRLGAEPHEVGAVAWEAIRDAVDVIGEEVGRLNQIVVDYLFAVRPMNVDLASGEVNEVLEELLRLLRPELKEAEIELREDLARELPRVLLDPRYLREALLNLIKNAIAAMVEMPSGDRPRVLSVSSFAGADAVTIRIGDTGPGIPPEIQGKIFEPYFTTRDFGSGLGLTLVYKIVKEHMGEIELDSKPGAGSTFAISIPVPQTEKRLLGFVAEAV
ncbi:MAG: ATP-binding protein [Spirochaetaceae bacterium]|nr:ATP-binding protein [Spirochaetaceae bacterium]MDE0228913.1 ATP-binding protein [Spirochaetaceae bacterium]MDE0446859.1 ATP-binding protein [Spirochaetaceae bacterium]